MGLSSTTVTDEPVISVATARSYIKSLYGKLDAHSREEVIQTGVQLGLISRLWARKVTERLDAVTRTPRVLLASSHGATNLLEQLLRVIAAGKD